MQIGFTVTKGMKFSDLSWFTLIEGVHLTDTLVFDR